MKRYTEMTRFEIDEIINKGGNEKNKLIDAIYEYLDSLDLSQKTRDVISRTDRNSICDLFAGLFNVKEIEELISELEGE